MKIVKIQIDIRATSEHDEGLQPKTIIMNDGIWKVPSEMFPRDMRLVGALEELVRYYNQGK